MRKLVFKNIIFALTIVLMVGLAIGLGACNDVPNNQLETSATTPQNNQEVTTPSEIGNANDKLIFKTLKIDGTNLYGEVSNATTIFSFLSEISLQGNADYTVSLDVYGNSPVNTKTVALDAGDNTFYVFATVDGQSTLYTVHIRRRPIYTVTFDTLGGTTVESQFVEEGYTATVPTSITKHGYTFVEWNYDFASPITSDTTIQAVWMGNKYTIRYDPDGDEILNDLVVTYGANYVLETPQKEGHTFEGWFDGEIKYASGRWYTTKDITLYPKWKANTYTVTTRVNEYSVGTVTPTNEYSFGSTVTVTAKTKKLGYTWLGWYDANNDILSTSLSYEFVLGASNVVLEAKWKIDDNLSDFLFTSTDTTCTILDVIDDTLLTYTIPEYVTDIEPKIFNKCKNLTNIFVAENNANYCSVDGILYNKPTTEIIHVPRNITGEITIPDGVLTIPNGAFMYRNLVTHITIPSSVSTIVSGAFHHCDALTHLAILGNDVYVYSGAFEYLDNLISMTAPCSVFNKFNVKSLESVVISGGTSIGDNAFKNCRNLKSVTIAETVTSIGDFAFANCTEITHVIIPDTVEYMGFGVFNGCISLESLTIPFVGASATPENDEYEYTFGYIFGDTFYEGSVEVKQRYLENSTGKTTNITYYLPSTLTSVKVTNGNVPSHAFYNCSNLVSITLPSNATSIGSYAFYYCSSLMSITIPDSVTSVGSQAFNNCHPALYTEYQLGKYIGVAENPYAILIEITENRNTYEINPDTKIIAYGVFSGCYHLTSITIPYGVKSIGAYAFFTSALTSIVIPNSVTSIGKDAFSLSSLTSIVIPDSVTSIENNAFRYCKALASITYEGTSAQWNTIKFGKDWNRDIPAAEVVCSDGVVKLK